jgi:GTP-binding protein EngB required for normal cell division
MCDKANSQPVPKPDPFAAGHSQPHMDVREYEQTKFEIADILRSASPIARAARPGELYPFEDLFARLAEDRFNIVVAGQFSRGKTSLMNAMLNTERLPTGIIPLTSVITTVQYGTAERAIIEYEERRLPSEIRIESLPEYITQRHNPGNAQRIKFARIELPSEILRRGFYLVDTPGLGSAILENTRTTEGFLPEADAFILVTSYDSPLSEAECRLLAGLVAGAYRIFLVINKQDLASQSERGDVREHIDAQLRGVMDENRIGVFSVSALDAMEATRSGDVERLRASGLPHFMDHLTQFLLRGKQSEFLRRMFGRARERLSELGNCAAELDRLSGLEQRIFEPGDPSRPPHRPEGGRVVPRFTSCHVCARIEREVREFLQTYQYAITIDREVQQALAADHGLCGFHTWQYAAMASPHGTCIGFPAVLERLAGRLRDFSGEGGNRLSEEIGALLPAQESCALCRVRWRAERQAIGETANAITAAAAQGAALFPDVCLAHVPRIVEAIPDRESIRKFLDYEADSLERVAEDMRRYALKRDGSRRAFTTSDELNADLRGLIALAGHRNVNFVRRLERD